MASTPESNAITAEETEVAMERHGLPASGSEPAEIEAEFPLVRQSSIYSLTLGEIQNTVCEPGRTFGSMNMDEFLTNIWNVEEGFDVAGAAAATHAQHADAGSANKQGSLSLPSPLFRKTVDEVWSEIHSENQQGRQLQLLQQQQHSRKPTLGEMTLEDFLIKAGVVKESGGRAPSPKPHAPTPSQYGFPGYSMGTEAAVGFGYGGGPSANGRRGEVYFYAGGGSGEGRMGNGFDGGGRGMQMGMVGSPGSPVSSDGICCSAGGGGQLDGFAGKNCSGGGGGTKREAVGTLEKVVERRQRRMIKNRESAARSRARKQAYTVELEAELNNLKEENARLREEERARQTRRQMILKAMAEAASSNMNKTGPTPGRCNSSPS